MMHSFMSKISLGREKKEGKKKCLSVLHFPLGGSVLPGFLIQYSIVGAGCV